MDNHGFRLSHYFNGSRVRSIHFLYNFALVVRFLFFTVNNKFRGNVGQISSADLVLFPKNVPFLVLFPRAADRINRRRVHT